MTSISSAEAIADTQFISSVRTLSYEPSENLSQEGFSVPSNLPNEYNVRKIRNRKLRQFYTDQLQLIADIRDDTAICKFWCVIKRK